MGALGHHLKSSDAALNHASRSRRIAHSIFAFLVALYFSVGAFAAVSAAGVLIAKHFPLSIHVSLAVSGRE